MSISHDAHELLGLLAYIYLEHSHPEKSITLLQALQEMHLANPQEQTMLALALLRTGKPDAALDVLDRLALDGIQDAPCHLIRSQVLHALDRKSEAQTAMRAYLRLRAQNTPMSADETDSSLPPPAPTVVSSA